jgi:hypothetical protein
MSDAYDKIDHFLRNNLNDADYAEYSAALDEVLTENQWPQDCGLSWDGHRISGDRASIDAVQRILHAAHTVELMRDRIKDLESRLGRG